MLAEKKKKPMMLYIMSVDEWISFQCDKSVASSLSILRRRLDAIFHHIISNPKTSFGSFSDMERMTINVMQSSFHSSPGRC